MPPDFTDELTTASEIVRRVASRHALGPDEAEDFASWATLRMIENDYATFKKFKGRSKFSTYLTTVVTHLFLDYRNAKWGKWRASAAAKRLGPVAIQLESLVYRDGHAFADALALLRERTQVEASDEQLEQIFVQIKPRYKRRQVGDEALETRPDSAPDPETRAMETDVEASVSAVSDAVSEALATLKPKEALILRLRFGEGKRIVDIARLLGMEQRKLYGEVERLLKKLKRAILERGVSAEQVRELLRWDDLDLNIDYDNDHSKDNDAIQLASQITEETRSARASSDSSGESNR